MSGETCISPTSLQCLETLKTITEWESPVHQKARDPILLIAHGSCGKNTDGYRWAKAQKEDRTLMKNLKCFSMISSSKKEQVGKYCRQHNGSQRCPHGIPKTCAYVTLCGIGTL